MKVVAIGLFGIVTAGCGGSHGFCKARPARIVSQLPPLRSGDYELTLLSDCGSRRGAASAATLTLVSATAADQSESSGEIARDFDGPPEFYGWTGLDFQKESPAM